MGGGDLLIKCDRHTESDLEYWEELEEMDIAYYDSHKMKAREENAIKEIQNFGDDCFTGISWGKDSVVLAHLVLRAVRNPIFVCAIGNYKTVAARQIYVDTVRDLFIGNFRYEEIVYPESPPHSKEKMLTKYGKRHISGVRSAESGKRVMSRKVHGISTKNACRPIIDWPTEAIFAYAAHYNLPLHPNYGMTGGGRYDRRRIRVGGSIGGSDGNSMGRTEWEKEYYMDILNRIKSSKTANP